MNTKTFQRVSKLAGGDVRVRRLLELSVYKFGEGDVAKLEKLGYSPEKIWDLYLENNREIQELHATLRNM